MIARIGISPFWTPNDLINLDIKHQQLLKSQKDYKDVMHLLIAPNHEVFCKKVENESN